MSFLYILGAGHSGSSLLDYLLGSVSDTVATGEIHRLSIDPTHMLCACGATIASCAYWEDARRLHSERQAPVSLETWADWPVTLKPEGKTQRAAWRACVTAISLGVTPPAWLTWWRRYLEICNNSWLLYDTLRAGRGARAVVDSTKNPLRLIGLKLVRPKQTFVVHLIRDGRAVTASRVRRTGKSWFMASLAWRVTELKAERALRHIPSENTVTVRYEDLCRQPLQEINRIRRLLTLPELESLPSLGGQAHMIPGNPVLLNGIDEIRLDDRWQGEVSSLQRILFGLVAGVHNRRYGYR
jgi:hypothetical protein